MANKLKGQDGDEKVFEFFEHNANRNKPPGTVPSGS